MRLKISFPKSIDMLDVAKENSIDICMTELYPKSTFVTATYEENDYIIIYEVLDFIPLHELKSLQYKLSTSAYDPFLKILTGET